MEKGKLTLYDRLKNNSAVILNGIFTFFAVIYALLQAAGWQLVPFSYGLVWVMLMVPVALFFWLALQAKEHTSQAKTISCNILPITGGLFSMWAVSFFEDHIGMGALLAVLSMIAALTLSVTQGERAGLGLLGKVIGGFLAIVILATLGFATLMSGFTTMEASSTAYSPDGIYLASAYSADQGATGAESAVSVRREIRKLPTPFGWICDVDEATVYVGEYDESISVSWRDEDTLLIGQSEVEMSQHFD